MWGPKPMEFNEIFTKFRNINASRWHILCTVFTEFSAILESFMLGGVKKFGEINSRC